ncbi:MAG: chromate efflux transporter [Myxococcales bacterium]|nr:chromate efflux transporter [Myxococcales bacterium]
MSLKPAVPFATAVGFWLWLGCVSFGGPAGQIAILHRELVERRRWISERRFVHALNFCMVLPGPEAQQLATYLGWLLHRTWGGIAAGTLFVLPSLGVLIALAWAYLTYGALPWVAALFGGIRPAVVAVVVHAAWRLGTRTLRTPWAVGMALVALVAVGGFDAPFPFVVLAAAVAGSVLGKWRPAALAGGTGLAASAPAGLPALIDDDTPTPDHARFSWPRLARVVIVGLAGWAAPFGALAVGFGLPHAYTLMAAFFTQAALLTFGGAYAVLPYVVQGAVHDHGWLDARQMLDGLALGESTPGPLIMIVAFVGYLGGHLGALLGPDHAFAGGVLGATVATWFTFLPSFVFILAGGPLVESSRGEVRLVAPLAAISAAVVGVILDLGFNLGRVVFVRGGAIDAFAASVALAAFGALVVGRRGVLEVVAVAALAGLARQLV